VIRWDFPVGFYTGKVGEVLVEAMAAWLEKLGLAQARIATELGSHFRMGLSIECFDAIRAALPAVTWSDCGEIMWMVPQAQVGRRDPAHSSSGAHLVLRCACRVRSDPGGGVRT
jgi:hypothetical protein